jgi:hypothetical protein
MNAFFRQRLEKQRQLRKEANRLKQQTLTEDVANCMLDPKQIIPCSVIDP